VVIRPNLWWGWGWWSNQIRQDKGAYLGRLRRFQRAEKWVKIKK